MGMRAHLHFPTRPRSADALMPTASWPPAAMGPGGAGRCAGAAPQRIGRRGVDVRMAGGDGWSIWVVAGILEAWLFAIWIL